MQTRRNVLRVGGGAALLTVLAGCSDETDGDSGEGSGNTDETGDDGAAVAYSDWAYDPTALGTTSMFVNLQEISTLLELDGLSEAARTGLRDAATNNYGEALAAADVDYALTVGSPASPAEVLGGSFDGHEIVEGMDLTTDESYGGFDLYAAETDDNGDATALIGTDGDYLVRTDANQHPDTDPREEIRLLIDTYNGDADAFVDVNDDFARLRDELGTGILVSLNAGTASSNEDAPDDAIVANGSLGEIDGDVTTATIVYLYKSENGVDLEELEANVEGSLSADEELTDIGQDGRQVTFEITTPTDGLEF